MKFPIVDEFIHARRICRGSVEKSVKVRALGILKKGASRRRARERVFGINGKW